MDITVLLGAPGAGKGTVATRIAGPLGAIHVSTGAMLRDALKAGTDAGLDAKRYMDRGELVPDAVLARLMEELLEQSAPDAHVLLDGYPRNPAQAQTLESLARRFGCAVGRAVTIEVPEDVILERLDGRRVCPACGANFHLRTLPPKRGGVCDACGAELVQRTDDQPGTARKRLAVYARQTAPLIEWYDQRGLLLRVDGSGEADQVAEAVLKAVMASQG